jgi:hypothetical protein
LQAEAPGPQKKQPLLSLKSQARPTQVDLVSRSQQFSTSVAGRGFYASAVAEDPGSVFAFVVADTVVAVLQADVGVTAGDGGVGLVGAFLEDDVVAADYALLGIHQFRHTADVDARFVEDVPILIGFASDHHH